MSKAVCGWKLLYSSCSGVEGRALEYLTGEIGKYILRDPGVYAVFTLPCEKVTSDSLPDCDAIVLGTLTENPLLRRFIRAEEIPAKGSLVRIVSNPEQAGKQLILIAGSDPVNVLYGAIDLMERIVPDSAPVSGDNLHYQNRVFRVPFPERDFANTPATDAVRSVFTWGHTINDYREYLRNLARMKFNRVILWNEYPVLNAQEVIDYAHSWGIEVYWGFAWGWSVNCAESMEQDVETLSDSIVEEWKTLWRGMGGDGIYFQTFTEQWRDEVNGESIARKAIEVVNRTAGRIFAEAPDLKIIFGLHLVSVKNELPVIATADPRLEILWENCGNFPHNTGGLVDPAADMAAVEKLLEDKIHPLGFVLKCQMMMDWVDFKHQAGPYVLGCASPEVVAHDRAFADQFWKFMEQDWLKHGRVAYDVVKRLHSARVAELNLVGNLTGKLHFPTMLAAELFWNTDEDYETIFARVMQRI